MLTKVGCYALTTFCLFLSWTIFRSESPGNTVKMLEIFLFLEPGGPQQVDVRWAWVFLTAAAVHFACFRGWTRRLVGAVPGWVYAVGYGAAWAVVLRWCRAGYRPFIYFQF